MKKLLDRLAEATLDLNSLTASPNTPFGAFEEDVACEVTDIWTFFDVLNGSEVARRAIESFPLIVTTPLGAFELDVGCEETTILTFLVVFDGPEADGRTTVSTSLSVFT